MTHELRETLRLHSMWLRDADGGQRANLAGADLAGADLAGSNLARANLAGANIDGAQLPAFGIPEFGPIRVWKALSDGLLAELEIPSNARMTASLIGRKCRASMAIPLRIVDSAGAQHECGVAQHDGVTEYRIGIPVYPDRYCDDIRVECAPGIHFFLTRAEAEAWL